ncbi:hypothetical protein ZIOFF_013974 [Zingiber officinale]|uniref:dUTP diphosphatase n=1 Tax=Zingiber officinale TaxID=94328 RepID=A0A8J5LR96_ZINOF|nr:hypothetical protein ZIOFF_013974 [Zingiber officinale]
MSYINTKATSSYKEALQATEEIEAPALGFCRPSEYKGGISSNIALIKQANTQIQLLVTILEKLEALEERIKKLEAREAPQQQSLPEVVIQSITNKIQALSIQEKPKESKGKLRVFTDPFQILKEEQAKIKRNIQVSILTRGYENWRNGEANLLVTRGLVGRLSNTPNVGFAYEVQNVVDYLASHGPTEVNTRNMLDGSVSLQFDNYQATTSAPPPKFNSRDEEVQSDEEEFNGHIISVLIQERRPEEELLVKRISSLAKLPVKRTPGAAGYDISITHAQDIPAREMSLLSTGICIQIPQNTYARIAPRSSAALQGIIIMGGVIDSDYRGEVKIMAFNTTNDDIFLEKQEYIAQLILERIATPSVREVEVLSLTSRGISGFGSTTIRQVCSSTKANPRCNGCYYCCSDEDYAAEYDEYVAARPPPEKKILQKDKKLKQKEVISPLAIKSFPEEKLLAMQKEARKYAVEQHKFYEEEANLNLLDGFPSMERSFAITTRQLRNYPRLQQLQEQIYSQEASSYRPPVDVTMNPVGSMEPVRRRYNNSISLRGNNGAAGEQASYSSLPAPCGPYPLLDQYEELAEGIGPSTNTPYEKGKRQHMEDIEDTAARNQQGISSIACGNSCLSSKSKKRTSPDVARSKEDYTSTSRTLY